MAPPVVTDCIHLRASDRAPLANGAHRGRMRIASVGVTRRYPWGTIQATREALADPALHEAMAGTPILIEHPEGMGPEADGFVMVDDLPHLRVGTILSADFDEQDGPDGALVAEYVIDHPLGLAWLSPRLSAGRAGASHAYEFDREPAPDGMAVDFVETRRYAPNHTALVDAPRDVTARALDQQEASVPDSAPTREMDSLREAMDAFAEVVKERDAACMERDAAYAERDTATSALDAMRAEMDAIRAHMGMDKEHAEDGADPKAMDASGIAKALDAAIEAHASRLATLRDIASRTGLDDAPQQIGPLREALAKHLGATKALDSAAADLWIDAAWTARQSHRASDSYEGAPVQPFAAEPTPADELATTF